MRISSPSSIRILALATNPETGASTRFRILQWEPTLSAAGFTLSLDAFFSVGGAEALYQRGRFISKIACVAAGTVQRWKTLRQAARHADLLLIHREAFPLGLRLFSSTLEEFPGPIVYDYDDAMFLPQRSGRGLLARLENLQAPQAIMKRSTLVLAGNEFLATYARSYAKRVVMLPTCIDTQRFVPLKKNLDVREPLVVGWIGSHSTAKYLHSLGPVLERVAKRVVFRLYVVGSEPFHAGDGVSVTYAKWNLEREVQDFQHCDIGIYPIWDDRWAQGKCAFKAIQFMACGVPVVASAVGANQAVIQDGVNGFLASTEDEWVERLTCLLSDAQRRQQLGATGRQTIEAAYSLSAHGTRLVAELRESLSRYGRADTSSLRAGISSPMPTTRVPEFAERD